MKILTINGYGIHIYADDCKQHHLPHCHVRHRDSRESVVSLPNLDIIVGQPVDKKVLAFILENLELLYEKWEEFNPDC